MKKLLISTMVLFAMLLVFSMGCEPDDPEEPYPPPNIDNEFGEMTDPRDGHKYYTIDIGTQTWMAENLNYETGESWCYDNYGNNCKFFGRLYDWNTAMNACPSGWHLPSDAEWTTLTDYLGGKSVAGGKMKTTLLWGKPNTGATNESGWSGLPGGSRFSYGSFGNLGRNGGWWSSSEGNAGHAWGRTLSYYYGYVYRYSSSKALGFSVRCLRDDN